MSTQINDLVSQGVAYLRRGNRVQARQLFEMALKLDDNNIQAWWWMFQSMDDDPSRLKLDKHTREIAARVPGGRETYTRLLEQSGVKRLTRSRLVSTSKSVGVQCPVDTSEMMPEDIVIVCPVCQRASHVECWEENLYHCGHFACPGMGLIDLQGAVTIEPALKESTIVVDEEDIPEETPWVDRETKEGVFIEKLVEHEIDNLVRASIAQAQEEEERKRREELQRKEVERQKAELARRTAFGFWGGLIPGIFFGYEVYQYSDSWLMAILTAYLCAAGISAAAKNSYLVPDRLTSALYSLLPKIFGAYIMFSTFTRWGNGLVAVILAILGLAIVERVLSARAIYSRKAFVTYSILGLVGLLTFYNIFD